MTGQYNFRRFNIWRNSVENARDKYTTTESFTRSEIYLFMKQKQHCNVSIPSNIAEETSKGSAKHFITSLEAALGATFENS